MAIRIVCVGKKHVPWIRAGIDRYQTRLNKPFLAEWVLVSHSVREGSTARQDESERILERLKDNERVILLDERGQLIDSPGLSRQLQGALESSTPVALVIGGAYGTSEELRRRADFVWSLSPLVFPHQLVRLIIIEQLYRAQEIAAGRPYHHD